MNVDGEHPCCVMSALCCFWACCREDVIDPRLINNVESALANITAVHSTQGASPVADAMSSSSLRYRGSSRETADPSILVSAVIDHTGEILCLHSSPRISAQHSLSLIPPVMRAATAQASLLGPAALVTLHTKGPRGVGVHVYQYHGTSVVVVTAGYSASHISQSTVPSPILAPPVLSGAASTAVDNTTSPSLITRGPSEKARSVLDSSTLDTLVDPLMPSLQAAVMELLQSFGPIVTAPMMEDLAAVVPHRKKKSSLGIARPVTPQFRPSILPA